MRVTALITYLNNFLTLYGDVEITSIALPSAMLAPVPLSPLLGSDDDDDNAPRLYVVTTQTGTAETFSATPQEPTP